MFTETLDKCVGLVDSMENMSYDQLIVSRKFVELAKIKYGKEEPYFNLLSSMLKFQIYSKFEWKDEEERRVKQGLYFYDIPY